jgi:hypothetical protein
MNDMAQPRDLAAVVTDQAVPADMSQLTCKQMAACVTGCTGGQMLGKCIEACIAAGSADALSYFTPLENCAKPACYDADAGSDACAQIGSGACETCLMTSCGSQFAACEAH